MPGPVYTGTHHCQLGGDSVSYRLRRSSRRTLGITVEPGGRLVVTAPEAVPVSRIEGVLRRRRGWIRRQIREAADTPPPPMQRQWVSGETHRFLGRQYRLKVQIGVPEVSLRGRYFMVTVGARDPAQVRAGMERWYRDHARSVFQRRAELLVAGAPRLGVREVPVLRVRRLAKRWGSCTVNGSLLMNVDAVKLPVGCVDYLLMHELCHVRVPHHGRRFWRLLEACMPDWERWRERIARCEV